MGLGLHYPDITGVSAHVCASDKFTVRHLVLVVCFSLLYLFSSSYVGPGPVPSDSISESSDS